MTNRVEAKAIESEITIESSKSIGAKSDDVRKACDESGCTQLELGLHPVHVLHRGILVVGILRGILFDTIFERGFTFLADAERVEGFDVAIEAFAIFLSELLTDPLSVILEEIHEITIQGDALL